MYNFDWHKIHHSKTARAAEAILGIIREIIEVKSVLDVGCGDGIWLSAAQNSGITVFRGVDGPWTRLDELYVDKDHVSICNLEEKFDLGNRFDLVLSLEVAEHISSKNAEVYIDNLVAHGDVVLFSAAIPYQGGFRHINEQWQSFWADKFCQKGYTVFDIIRPQIWTDDSIWFWYKQNTIVYVNNHNKVLMEYFNHFISSNKIPAFPIDLVHPEKYVALASYEEIAFKPLIKKLPSRSFGKLVNIINRKL